MQDVSRILSVAGAFLMASYAGIASGKPECDKACLEGIGDQYRAAYVKHDPTRAPIARHVRFTENNGNAVPGCELGHGD